MTARERAIQILEDPNASDDAKDLARRLLTEVAAPVYIPQPYVPGLPQPPYVPGTHPLPWEGPIWWGTTTGGHSA